MNEELSEFFKALAHPVRIEIIQQLYNGPICVCHINEKINSSQANISKHLKILKHANIVVSKKNGMFQYYELKDDKIKNVIKEVIKLIDK